MATVDLLVREGGLVMDTLIFLGFLNSRFTFMLTSPGCLCLDAI